VPGQPLLLLRLEGPLQSWGLRSRWDVRDSGDEPSKSGVIGLLGCALGYPMYDRRLEELDSELTLGIRVECEGRKLVDFHTITGTIPMAGGGVKGTPDDPSTIISPRSYLQDAAFLAILSGPAELLFRCRSALLAPKWPIYLGRKSCVPTRPVFEGLSYEYANLEDALRRHPWRWEGRATLREYPARLRCVMEDPLGEAVRPDRIRTNPARMYESRRVRVLWADFPGESEEGETCISHA
jgi:CRISPR system Cascade subunit CasD